jgi:hypothetical protein
MVQTTKVITGKVTRDRFGSWEDCSPGIYIDTDMVETLFSEYTGQNIRVTIEVIDDN